MSPEEDKLQMSKSIDNVFSGNGKNYMSRNNSRIFMFYVNGADSDARTCTFSRGCCKVNGTAINTVCEGLPHLRKYDF
jgi:hypothetical protein